MLEKFTRLTRSMSAAAAMTKARKALYAASGAAPAEEAGKWAVAAEALGEYAVRTKALFDTMSLGDDEAGNLAEAVLDGAKSGMMACRAYAALAAAPGKATPGYADFGREAGRLAEKSWNMTGGGDSGWAREAAAPLLAMGFNAGALAEKGFAMSAAENGETVDWEKAHAEALRLSRQSARASRMVAGEGEEDERRSAEVAGWSQCAQIMFMAGETERAGHWLRQALDADRKSAELEFGMGTRGGRDGSMPKGFGEWVRNTAAPSPRIGKA